MKEQELDVPLTTLLGATSYREHALVAELAELGIALCTPQKQLKGQELNKWEKYFKRCLSRLRLPIEDVFSWLQKKIQIYQASTVRSDEALKIPCWYTDGGLLEFSF